MISILLEAETELKLTYLTNLKTFLLSWITLFIYIYIYIPPPTHTHIHTRVCVYVLESQVIAHDVKPGFVNFFV